MRPDAGRFRANHQWLNDLWVNDRLLQLKDKSSA